MSLETDPIYKKAENSAELGSGGQKNRTWKQ